MKLDNDYLLFKKKDALFWISLPFLYVLSFVYCFGVALIRFLYAIRIMPSFRPKLKVISVGNITLGGTGKTPLVETIVHFFSTKGKKAGIIIRGYKRPRREQCCKEMQTTGYFQLGDEASMLKTNISESIMVCVGRDKNKSARQLEKDRCEVAVVDDGFQHWRLRRDLDIVTIDSTVALSDQKLLPVGRLREPLRSLRRADIFVLTKTDFHPESAQKRKEELRALHPEALVASSVYEPMCFYDIASQTQTCEVALDQLKGQQVFMLVGVGNPFYFDKLVSGLGLKIAREFIFPDHYHYDEQDIDEIKGLADRLGIAAVITTQKDAERLKHLRSRFGTLRLLCLKIRMKITENEDAFYRRLRSV